MALRDVVNRLFRREPVETTAVTSDPSSSRTNGVDLYAAFLSERAREQIVKTCREMYKTDSRVEKAHRFYARDIVRAGFIIKTDNAKAKQIADELQTRLDLNQKLEDAVRLTSRDGDSFFELVVDDGLRIVKMTRKPTLKMHRASNGMDEFSNSRRAFWLDPRDYAIGGDVPADAVWFAEWQIVHARWNHDEENRYGTPMFASATSAFKRAQDGELNVAVRRKLGGSQLRHHVVEGSASDVEKYREMNAAVLGKVQAVTDFFSNKAGTMTVHQGDGNIDKIADVQHHIATMMTASDVPMELIAYGGELNRDILGEKKAEYEETLSQGREWLTAQVLKPLLERQWLLAGILPETVDYKIVWRTAKAMTPADLRDLGDGLARLRVLGVKEEVIQQLAAMFLRGVDEEMMNGDGMDSAAFAQALQGISI
jgi:hypothetical protein